MIGSSKLTTYVLAPLLIGIFYWTPFVSGQGCNITELTAMWQCILPYYSQFTPYFGRDGTCNRTLITQQVCRNYSDIVTCENGASLSTSTCRPYMVTWMDLELAISCKVNDFNVTCTNASQLNEGSPNQGCDLTELTAIRQCISPYSTNLINKLGTGGTCNRIYITQPRCSDYGDIVTCVNNASLSSTTCRPYMVSQIDYMLAMSCKINDFNVTCTNASQLNEGSPNQGCNLTEVTAIRQCISPYSTNLISYFGRGGTCNRTLITQQVCSNYGNIITCVNSTSLSTSCILQKVSQMDNELAISCKVNDYDVTCTNASQLNEGSPNQGCNLTEVTAIRQCLSPYSTDLISYFGRGGTCNRTFITQQVCSNYGNIVTCVNSTSLSTSCILQKVSQMDNELAISCKVNDFNVTCTNASQLNEATQSTGSPNQGCDLTEVTAIRQCISPYSTNLISYFGRGGTCDRTLMTQQVCSNYGNIVTCVNSASLSTSCILQKVSQMDNELGISCKINDFAVTCSSASKLNEGSNSGAIFVTMVTHVILAVFAFPVRNS